MKHSLKTTPVPPNTLSGHSPRIYILKRRLYIVGSAFGVMLSILYGISTIQEGINVAFVFSIGIMLELFVLLILFIFAPHWMGILELLLYFGMVTSLLLLGELQFQVLYARGVLNPDKLGFLIMSLVLWLTILQLGAFLALPFRRVRQLLIVIWIGITIIVVSAILIMRPPEEWRYSYVISWISGLTALCMVSLQINWLGQRQQHQATTDALTGITNRHLLSDLLKQQHQRTLTQQRSFTIMLIDIDNFKLINDNYGHAIGDQVLKAVARVITQHLQANDHVGRWGGDEFLVLLVDTNLHIAQQIAEQIRQTLEQQSSIAQTTLSIGIHAHQAGQSVEETLACADHALYAAKQGGRNQIGAWAQH